MSDDESMDSRSASDSDDVGTGGLIANRGRRSTAGNLYATLRANLDDEELQKELLAEDDSEDAGDYQGSDKDVEDDELESSSDEEDAGPPGDGDEDLEGEKTIRKQERVEARNKRKAQDARLKLPAWREKKKVKLADDVKTEDGSSAAEMHRPKKKSERSNWLPSGADAPVRQSGRSLAVANRENVHANLKQSAERSEKQRRVMKVAAEREKGRKRMENLSQEERLKKCERIERETGKELGRFEREEAERQRIREEMLAAKRKRGIEGPVVRAWSGSVMWEGPKIKVNRLQHGSQKMEDVKVPGESEWKPSAGDQKPGGPVDQSVVQDLSKTAELAAPTIPVPPAEWLPQQATRPELDLTGPAPPPPPAVEMHHEEVTTVPGPVSWLQGIQEYAAQPIASTQGTTLSEQLQVSSQPPPPQQATQLQPQTPAQIQAPQHPQQPSQLAHSNLTQSAPLPQPQAPAPTMQSSTNVPPFPPGWPPGTNRFAVRPPPALPPAPPPAPLIREQAARSLIMLEAFESLEVTTVSKKTPKSTPKPKDSAVLEEDPVKCIMLPGSYPAFSPEESKYLITRPKPRKNAPTHMPPAPVKPRCALTSWVAKFQDPKTKIAYADMHQYKALQRVIAGGNQWSPLLGCWVGPALGGGMGRPARGVPAGFAAPKKES